jgi:hypothetical protein
MTGDWPIDQLTDQLGLFGRNGPGRGEMKVASGASGANGEAGVSDLGQALNASQGTKTRVECRLL